jgi:hypothetical protein
MDPDFSADSMDCMNLGLGVVSLKHSNLVFDHEVLIAILQDFGQLSIHRDPEHHLAIVHPIDNEL